MNTWKRKALALASVPLLAVPSAIGVYTYLAPQSGQIGAGLAASGFEVLYIGVNILIIATPELRRYARNVSLGAVIVAVLMNSLAHYADRVPDAYQGASLDLLAALLALIASAPLAGLAYAVSVLLHRLSEEDAPRVDAPIQLDAAIYARPQQHDGMHFSPPQSAEMHARAMHHACPNCGASLDRKRYAAARRWGRCAACKPAAP